MLMISHELIMQYLFLPVMLDELSISSYNMQTHYSKIHKYSVVIVHDFGHRNNSTTNKHIFINNSSVV